jgi:hypothetical protein
MLNNFGRASLHLRGGGFSLSLGERGADSQV